MSVTLIFAQRKKPTPPPPPPPPPDTLLAAARREFRALAYYGKWLRDNRRLGPMVDAYITGDGPRPTDEQLGDNHFGRALVLIEDERRRNG